MHEIDISSFNNFKAPFRSYWNQLYLNSYDIQIYFYNQFFVNIFSMILIILKLMQGLNSGRFTTVNSNIELETTYKKSNKISRSNDIPQNYHLTAI